MGKIKIGIIGAGLRGNYTYGKYMKSNFNDCEIIFVVEKRKGRREEFCNNYNLAKENAFESIEDFFEANLKVDGVIIATGDDNHYNHAKIFLEKGYNVLLELPVANTLDRLINLNRLYENYKEQLFMSCNVMRYNDIFIKIKEIIYSKELGQLVNIQYNKNIGYVDYVHNYVRGKWRIDSDSSPLILNNSCNDLDILLELIESECTKVASFGSLNYMNRENFRLNMGENCFRCSVEENCSYSAKKIYLQNENNRNYSVHLNPTKENLLDILPEGPYGRCIYRCDNNVVDNMINILNFESGVNVNLNISAFTKESNINMKLLFSNGELECDFIERKITVKKFIENENKIIDFSDINIENVAQTKLLNDFIVSISNSDCKLNKSHVKSTIESHIIAFALEYSRISEEVIYVKDFYENAVYMTDELEKALL
ncbi:MAG: Gfo/Idh/MocA family protein [Peptostreptococcaceae bacterium]